MEISIVPVTPIFSSTMDARPDAFLENEDSAGNHHHVS